jgi:hypothetical protein
MRRRLIIICVKNDIEIVKHIDKLVDFDQYKKEKHYLNFLIKILKKKQHTLLDVEVKIHLLMINIIGMAI